MWGTGRPSHRCPLFLESLKQYILPRTEPTPVMIATRPMVYFWVWFGVEEGSVRGMALMKDVNLAVTRKAIQKKGSKERAERSNIQGWVLDVT